MINVWGDFGLLLAPTAPLSDVERGLILPWCTGAWMERLRQLIHEIHRRSLWQVLGIYLLASWAVLQVVDTLVGTLGLPLALRLQEWFPPLALALLLVGLPIVLATAFVQEGGPRREAKDVEVLAPPDGAAGLFNWRNAFGGGVLAFALLGFVGTGWILFGGGLRPASIEQSIAVLPFEDLSPERDQQYFVEGLSEEIINALSQIGDLKVSARTSTFLLAEQGTDIATVASTLGVANVLEGSVRKEGDQIRVIATLIEAESGFQLWSNTYNRELTDIFQVQDEIARAITAQLQVTLSGEQQTQLVARATENTEAHEAYLRGRYLVEQRTDESLRNAITAFGRAVDLDPEYAEAYSGLADSNVLAAIYTDIYGVLPDYRATMDEGLTAARRAVELDPDLGMAHTSLGFGLWNLGEWNGAEQEFEQAIRVSPQYAPAHQWYALLLVTTGRADEAVVEAERAVELDPVYRQAYRNLIWPLRAAGRTEEAIQRSREMIELAPDWPTGWEEHARLLLWSGEYAEGLDAGLQHSRLLGQDVEAAREAYQAVIRYRQTGEPQIISEPPDWWHWGLTWWYANVGQPDRAIDLIEEQLEKGDVGNAALEHVVNYSDLLGDQPRYRALIEEAGITW